jgi:hypothetical protein
MSDADVIRAEQAALLNENAAERAKLEELYGKVWDTDQLQEEFEAIGFAAPLIVVRRKSDGVKGTLYFQHHPRFYFNWSEHKA